MASLEERRVALEARRVELTHRLGRLKTDAAQEHSSDSAEQAQERENDEVVDAIGVETRDAIAQVNAALERIDDGAYGACADCGGEISSARLEAVPEATHCVNCAQ